MDTDVLRETPGTREKRKVKERYKDLKERRTLSTHQFWITKKRGTLKHTCRVPKRNIGGR